MEIEGMKDCQICSKRMTGQFRMSEVPLLQLTLPSAARTILAGNSQIWPSSPPRGSFWRGIRRSGPPLRRADHFGGEFADLALPSAARIILAGNSEIWLSPPPRGSFWRGIRRSGPPLRHADQFWGNSQIPLGSGVLSGNLQKDCQSCGCQI
jgi:hypothetical protein